MRFRPSDAIVAIVLLFSQPVFAQDNSTPTFTDLKKLPDIHLKPQSTFQVDFEATVAYWDPARRKLFVQDGDQAIFVRLSPENFDLAKFRPERRSRLRVIGTFGKRDGCVDAKKVEVLPSTGKLRPIKVELAKLKRGNHWSRLTELEGELQRVIDSNVHTQLVLKSGEQKITCFIHGNERADEFAELVGGRIALIGVLDWATYPNGAARAATCHVMSFDDVTIESFPRDRPSPIVVDELGEIANIEDGTRISAIGCVTYLSKGANFVIEDSQRGMLVEYEGTDMVKVGSRFRVVGTLRKQANGDRLMLEQAEKLAQKSTPSVIKTTARKIVADHMSFQRVSVVGTIENIKSDGDEREVTLSSEEFEFRARFPASDEKFDQLELRKGERLGCLGVVFLESESEKVWFTVHVRSMDDLWVDRETVHLDKRTAGYWLLGVGILTLASFVWIFAMRSQVRRKTQHLADLTATLNASYQAVSEGVLVIDANNRAASVNTHFEQVTGIRLAVTDDLVDLARRLQNKYQPVEDCDFWNQLTGELVGSVECEMQTPETNRQRVHMYLASIRDDHDNEIGKLLTIRDITRQKELESHLVQSQKMEAVGSLAGGIAHDFNNLLMVMSFNVGHARALSANNAELQACLGDTEIAVGRAAELVKNLLGFSRRSMLDLQKHSLNESVERVAQLLRRTFPSSIELETSLDPMLSPCRMDETQIEQVLMNVCLNARDALSYQTGHIVISTSMTNVDGRQMVRLCVDDDGVGMSKEQQLRLFEPFFTTKATGEGTGLGMSMSYGIVTQHNGWIESECPGTGTRISIYLPACGSPSIDDAVSDESDTKQFSFSGRVLVVDDDTAVRRATALLVAQFGCHVVEAEDGQSALDLANQEKFDLVMLDLNMPGMSGREVLAILNEDFPELPVVICTGYLHDVDSLRSETGASLAGILRKPFQLADVQQVCESALGSFVSPKIAS